MYISIQDLNPYMAVQSDYNLDLVESKINLYCQEINTLTNNVFVATSDIEEYSLQNQKTTLISFPAYQDNSNLKFYLDGEELTPDQYIKINPKFDVVVKGVKQAKPVTKIKLKICSFPEHFEFKITGNKYWCDGLPDDLYFTLLETIVNDIKYNTLVNPKNQFRLTGIGVKSEKTGTRSMTYQNESLRKNVMDMLDYGISATKNSSVISRYRNESSNFINTLYRDNCKMLGYIPPYNTF